MTMTMIETMIGTLTMLNMYTHNSCNNGEHARTATYDGDHPCLAMRLKHLLYKLFATMMLTILATHRISLQTARFRRRTYTQPLSTHCYQVLPTTHTATSTDPKTYAIHINVIIYNEVQHPHDNALYGIHVFLKHFKCSSGPCVHARAKQRKHMCTDIIIDRPQCHIRIGSITLFYYEGRVVHFVVVQFGS